MLRRRYIWSNSMCYTTEWWPQLSRRSNTYKVTSPSRHMLPTEKLLLSPCWSMFVEMCNKHRKTIFINTFNILAESSKPRIASPHTETQPDNKSGWSVPCRNGQRSQENCIFYDFQCFCKNTKSHRLRARTQERAQQQKKRNSGISETHRKIIHF